MDIFNKIKNGLTRTREQLLTKIEWAVKGRTIDENAFDEVEAALLFSDAGIETTAYLIDALKERWKRGQIQTSGDIRQCLIEEVEKILLPIEVPIAVNSVKPFVILTLGVNGVGKTTTIAKIAKLYKESKKKVLIGACDTFRAAAIEQIQVWADKLDIDVVRHKEGSDPAAVAYDAIKAAQARSIDVLMLDTAGRLHTKANLMEEMKKIKRVLGKEASGAPQETLLVVDATNGQNAIAQTKTFNEALNLTGMVITKLDGTAKGGFMLPIARIQKIPIRFIGVGEQFDDLIPFDARNFSRALFE